MDTAQTNGRTYTLRPVEERDQERVTELLNIEQPAPVTTEERREWQRQADPARIRLNLVAEESDGRLSGYAHALRDPWNAPGEFWLYVVVDPAARQRGIGTALLDTVTRFAQEHGATTLKGDARDGAEAGLRFAERHGYVEERHSFESVLDLRAFDPSPYAGLIERLEAEGVRFTSLAEVDSPEARRKLFALNQELVRDEPGDLPSTERPYEAFEREVFQASWFRAEGQLLAAIGDEFVGLAAVAIYPEKHSAYHMITGTRRDQRGRGLATALKLRALAFARAAGAETIRTNNDSKNAPMLAINRKLGFTPEPGDRIFRRMLG